MILRKTIILLSVVFLLAVCFAGCDFIIPEKVFSGSDNAATGPVKIEFVSSNPNYGKVLGASSQTISPGKVSRQVVAHANDFCVFTGWSDGVKDAIRSGETFEKNSTITANFELVRTGLPWIEITMPAGDEVVSKDIYETVTVTAMDGDGNVSLDSVAGKLRGRGNATWKMEKKSYKLKLDKKENLLNTGTGPAKDWVLLANHCDQSLIRNQVAFYLARNMEGIEYTVGCQQVEVFINGIYKGVYLLTEQIEVQENRLNLSYDTGTLDTGYLVELDDYADDDNPTGENKTFVVAGDKMFSLKSDVAPAQIPYIKGYLQKVHDAIMSGEEHRVRKYVDLDSCIDAYLIEEFTMNIDVGWSSFFFYKKAGDDHIYFGPLWDFDLAIGNDKRLRDGGSKGFYVGDSHSEFKQRSLWFGALMEQHWFRVLVRKRWEEKRDLFADASAYAAVCTELVRDAAERNFDIWGSLGKRINQEPDHIVAYTTYDQHADNAVAWLADRYEWLNAYIKINLPTR